MSYSLSIFQDDRVASVIVTLTEDAPVNFTFSFDISMFATDVRVTDTSLLSGGTNSTTSDLSNFTFTASSSGTFVGPLTAGTPLLAYEFEVLEAGTLTVNSFAATRDGVGQVQPILPDVDLDVPAPLTADYIAGDFEVGSTLSVDTSQLPSFGAVSAQTLEYSWIRDMVLLPLSEQTATYTLGPDDEGTEITMRVSYFDQNLNERVVLSSNGRIVGEEADPNMPTAGDDVLVGDDEDSFVDASTGDDTITGAGGNDSIDGGRGDDTAVLSGSQSGYTLLLAPAGTRLTDRVPDRDGVDLLTSIEFLKFEGDTAIPPFALDQFDGGAQLSTEEYKDIIGLYIAYFDRAPDALGLNFWANAFADGTSLVRMANLFTEQPETQAAYPDGTSSLDFAITVYENVLGRTPDQAGLDFWVGVLVDGSVTRDTFILEVLAGARAAAPAGATQDFVDQQTADQAFLDAKIDIGSYFSVTRGMSDTQDADSVMALFDGTQASIDAAVSATDAAFARAENPDNGAFLIQILGVIDNPFPEPF